MNSLFETLQKVVESGREDPSEGLDVGSSGDVGGVGGGVGGDMERLPDDVRTLKKLILAKQRAFDTLYEESAELQKQLSRATRHLTLQRDLWLTTLELQENTIQSLVEAAVKTFARPSPSSTSSPSPIPESQSPIEEGGVYLNALLEQIELLKRSLMAMTAQKEDLQVALDLELRRRATGQPGLSSPLSLVQTTGDEVGEEHQATLRKLNDLWEREREAYEAKITELTRAVQRSTESAERLAERHNSEVVSLAQAKRSFMDSIAPLPRGDHAAQAPRSSSSLKSAAGDGVPSPLRSSASLPHDAEEKEPTGERAANEDADDDEKMQEAGGLRERIRQLRGQLEQSEAECRAREDALTAMYEDNKRLEEDNHRLREELTLLKEQSAHDASAARAVHLQLSEEMQRSRELQASLTLSQQAQERLQRDLSTSQEAVRKAVAGSPTAKSGSVIVANGGRQKSDAPRGPHSRARDFVQSASAKFKDAKDSSTTWWVRGRLRVILVLTLSLTVLMFLSLALGGNGPVAQYDDMTDEMTLRAQLETCKSMLKKANLLW